MKNKNNLSDNQKLIATYVIMPFLADVKYY